MFNNQEVLQLIIISFIPMTLMLNLGMILKGEIRCWSLSGMRVLITAHSICSMHLMATIVKIIRKANRLTEENEMRETVNFTI